VKKVIEVSQQTEATKS